MSPINAGSLLLLLLLFARSFRDASSALPETAVDVVFVVAVVVGNELIAIGLLLLLTLSFRSLLQLQPHLEAVVSG